MPKNDLILTEKQLEENHKQRIYAVIYATCQEWNVNPRIPVEWVPIARRIWNAIEASGCAGNWNYQMFVRSLADRIWADHIGDTVQNVKFSRQSGIVRDQKPVFEHNKNADASGRIGTSRNVTEGRRFLRKPKV